MDFLVQTTREINARASLALDGDSHTPPTKPAPLHISASPPSRRVNRKSDTHTLRLLANLGINGALFISLKVGKGEKKHTKL